MTYSDSIMNVTKKLTTYIHVIFDDLTKLREACDIESCCVCHGATGLHGSSGKLTGSTSSLNKLTVQGSNSRRSQSSSLLDMGNMSASDLDVADRTKFDKVTLPGLQILIKPLNME